MNKKTLRDVDLKGKRVVMRVDFNVPIKEGVIKDDTRIKGALASIKYVLENGGSLVLMSHLGRPAEKGYEADFSLKPVAEYLSKMLGKPVVFAADCANADKEVAAMKPGDIVRHFKGKRYQILYFAKDSETQQDVVVYRALYGERGVWVRPMEMFFSPVDRQKYPDAAQTYRFERTEETADD